MWVTSRPEGSPIMRSNSRVARISPGLPAVACLLGLLLCAAAVADPHTFRFEPPAEIGGVRSVAVAGSFNGWSPHAHPMEDRAGDGIWTVTIDLPHGVHHYKFVVNGEHWMNDPESDVELEQPDGHGGVNSAVLVGPDARKLPPARAGHINVDGVIHEPSDPFFFSATTDGLVRVTVMAQAGDVEEVVVHHHGSAKPSFSFPLHRVEERRGFDVFSGQTRVGIGVRDPLAWGFAAYKLELRDGEVSVVVGDERAERSGWFTPPPATFDAPAWARDLVWYQVFLERFRDGDPQNNPERAPEWTARWFDTHADIGEVEGKHNFYRGEGNVWRRRYGGDLRGLIDKLPYLRHLGVNAIYLNPVFHAPSSHKYDATDHRHIDPHFGPKAEGWPSLGVAGDRVGAELGIGEDPADASTWQWTPADLLFLDFLDEAHEQGFRVIIDGVWNHVGTPHWAFQDVLRRGMDSPYADWFDIIDWGDPRKWGHEPWWEVHGKPGGIQWRAWDRDNGDLPAFAKTADGLADGPRAHVFAVTERWMRPVVEGVERRGVDGWRLDVPHDIPMPFWREWRRFVRELNPEALLIGEVWGTADEWLRGDVFDGVMNYQFAMTAVDFFVHQQRASTPTQFLDRLSQLYHRYPLAAALSQQNLIGSHDTDRAASMFVNPDRDYDRDNRLQYGHDYSIERPTDEHWTRFKQALVAKFTFPGSPMIYYGDEVGMWGADDPNNRKPMLWSDLMPYDDPELVIHEGLFEWHRRLAAARARFAALRSGHLLAVFADDEAGVAVYARAAGRERVYVAFNRSNESRSVDLPSEAGGMRDWLSADQAEVVTGRDGRPELVPRGPAKGQEAADGGRPLILPGWSAALLAGD
jgi:cyclomaltodextrinase